MIGSIILLIVLILLNAIFASAEIAVISMNDAKLKKLTEEGNKKSYQADKADGTACQIPGYHTGSDHAGRLPEQCFCRRLFCGSSCRLVYRSWGTYSQNCVKFCCRY